MRQYTVILEWDAEAAAYSAVVPVLPGCTSQGRTLDDALTNVREAIAGHVAILREMGEPIPDDVTTAEVQVAA